MVGVEKRCGERGSAPGGVAHGGLESKKGVKNGETNGQRERGRWEIWGRWAIWGCRAAGEEGRPGGGSGAAGRYEVQSCRINIVYYIIIYT